MIILGVEGLEEKIKTCGLYHSKAKISLPRAAFFVKNMAARYRNRLRNSSSCQV